MWIEKLSLTAVQHTFCSRQEHFFLVPGKITFVTAE